MLPFFWYLLKVIICSGILFGYYWLFLRNKIFHRYNRFYLLAAMLLSLLLPLLKINFWQPATQQNQAIRVLQAVSAGDEYMNNIVITANKSNWSLEQLYSFAYLLVSVLFLLVMIRTLYLILNLLKKYPVQQIEEISFVNTDDNSTPFSFLKYIFWNSSIDMGTTTGRQIFKHEVAHIREKHTYDKLFVNITLIFCWCNPFFWLYRKELNMIHEFIADKKAVEDSDTAAFAAMILQAAYPKHRFELANNFFYSPIKRRLLMLTKIDNPKVSYIARLMVLPLAVLVFAAFTFKAKTNSSLYHGKKITVVIDAGHGGKDLGASSADGIYEKDLTLAISKKLKEMNSNDAIEILLTRDEDTYMDPQQKVAFAKSKNADLFISFHIDNGPKESANKHTGISFWVSKDEFPNARDSKILASAIVNEFSNNYGLPVMEQLNQRQMGVWILQANSCPAVLIEAGFINNDRDMAYLQTEAAKETIAKNVLAAIEKFASSNIKRNSLQDNISKKDTMPYGMFINVKHAGTAYLKSEEFKNKALVIVDSKEIGNVGNNYVERSDEKYSTVVVYNPTEAKKIYGLKGKYGVIKLTQKDAMFITADAVFYDEKSKLIKLSGANKTIEGDLSNSLIYLEDKIISPEELNQIPPAKISSVSILKADKIDGIVDAKGKTSVIYVSLKPDDLPEVVIKSSANNSKSIEQNNPSPSNINKNDEPKIYLGKLSGGRISLDYLKAQKQISVSPGYTLVNATIYIQGPGFDKNVVQIILTSISLSKAQATFNKCQNGTQIIFDNVQVKDKYGVQQTIKSPPGFIVGDIGTADGKISNSIVTDDMKTQMKATGADIEKGLLQEEIQNQEIQKLKQKLLLEQQNKAKPDYAEKQLQYKTTDTIQLKRKLQQLQLEKEKQNLLLQQQNKAKLDYAAAELQFKTSDAAYKKAILEQKELLTQQNNIVFTKAEVIPMFTGGEDAWREYLVKNLKTNTPLAEGWKAGKYTVIVKFIVHTDGTVSDVTTENYKGSKTAQHCIEVIKNAPKWQPAIQNGRKVNAYKKQPITFVIE